MALSKEARRRKYVGLQHLQKEPQAWAHGGTQKALQAPSPSYYELPNLQEEHLEYRAPRALESLRKENQVPLLSQQSQRIRPCKDLGLIINR